jgi:hypothetical protein
MFSLEGSSHYDTVVERLVEEYAEQLDSTPEVAGDIARAVVGGATVIEATPVCRHHAGVWGEAVEATGGDRMIPTEVVMYSDAEIPHVSADTLYEIAVAALTADIASVRRDRGESQ